MATVQSPDIRVSASVKTRVRDAAKVAVRSALPLELRKVMAGWLGQREWLPQRDWWATELLRDFATKDPSAYHRFLWSKHLAYARTYEINERYGEGHIHASRHEL